MIRQSHLYQILGYAGLLPFLLGTYFTWCGPMQEILFAAELFSVYSVAVLSFIAGSWWGYSLGLPDTAKTSLIIASCFYALLAASSWLIGYLPLSLIILGIGYVAIWLHEFFITITNVENSYRTMRTVLTLTVFVCHLLVAMQVHNL